MTATIEIRETPHNRSFPGYCAEFYMSDILLAAVPLAGPAYEVLLKHYSETSEIVHTCVSKNNRGQWVKSKVKA